MYHSKLRKHINEFLVLSSLNGVIFSASHGISLTENIVYSSPAEVSEWKITLFRSDRRHFCSVLNRMVKKVGMV